MAFQEIVGFAHVVLFLMLIHASDIEAFPLPNIPSEWFVRGQLVPVQVNVVTSVRTHLPYDYYTDFPTCHPKAPISGKTGNLGGVLMGDRIKSSPYESLQMLNNFTCKTICEKSVEGAKQQNFLIKAIGAKYRIHLLLDGLPLAEARATKGYVLGVPLGYIYGGAVYINNHIHFTVEYTVEETKDIAENIVTKYRILSFVGEAHSLDHGVEPTCEKVSGREALSTFPPLRATSRSIMWSYGVTWVRSDNKWSTRWDVYLNVQRHSIRWYSIINSMCFVTFLSAFVATLMFRVIRRDLGKIHRIELEGADAVDEAGWKMLSRDVFRPPTKAWLLACFAGTGVQLLGMFSTVLVFAFLGFFSPQSRGSHFTAVLVCFVLLGLYAGYTSARLLKLWNATKWKYVFATGTLVPAMVFGTFFVINILVWSQSSSAAVPLLQLTIVVAMWFFINIPLVFIGAILGFKRSTISVPSSYNQIPRHVPMQPWYTSKTVILLSGFPPFAAVAIEVYFILQALWLDQLYYVFGFLLLVSVILLLTSSEIAVIMVYLSLCAEDYRWCWRAFFIGASSGFFLHMYSILCAALGILQLDGVVPILLYLGYMTLLSFLFAVTMGAVGFFASFFFVCCIYRFVKSD